jgi:hypothetical protein
MTDFKWLAALGIASMALACGGEIAADESETDDLSSSTVSMEMVRANPALLPGVKPADGVRVNGRARPTPAADVRARGAGFHGRVDESSWLYAANQLGQFLHLTQPAIAKADVASATSSRQPGDLFDDTGKMEWSEVDQGGLGDCYFISAVSAVLLADKSGAMANSLIVPRTKNGKVVSYYVSFFQASGRKVRIEVDPDLPHGNKDGSLIYATSSQNKPGYEEWSTSLVEKAYALWHKSYEAIGNGGYAADGLFALTGKKTRHIDSKDAKVVAAIETAANQSHAQAACTRSETKALKFPLGIYADHCYTLLGIHRVNGQVFVKVRNPWGPGSATDAEPTEPPTADGTPDGIFEVSQADFAKYWDSADIVP